MGCRSAAIVEYQKRKTEVRLGKFLPQDIKGKHPTVLFSELVSDYLEKNEFEHRSFRDTKRRSLWWQKHFNGRVANGISALDVERARKLLAAGKSSKLKDDLSDGKRARSTVNRYLAALKAIYSFGIKTGKVTTNPVKLITLNSEADRKRMRYLGFDEEARLLKVIPNLWLPLFVVAINTGLRRGELLNLKWTNIDLRRKTLFVEQSKSGKPRFVPMRSVVIETLQSLPHMINNPYVFFDANGNRVKSITRAWDTWLKEAEIKDFRWHDLRHTFASRLVNAGVSLDTVQEILGHSTIEMTQRYSHLTKGHLNSAVNVPIIPDVAPEVALTEATI